MRARGRIVPPKEDAMQASPVAPDASLDEPTRPMTTTVLPEPLSDLVAAVAPVDAPAAVALVDDTAITDAAPATAGSNATAAPIPSDVEALASAARTAPPATPAAPPVARAELALDEAPTPEPRALASESGNVVATTAAAESSPSAPLAVGTDPGAAPAHLRLVVPGEPRPESEAPSLTPAAALAATSSGAAPQPDGRAPDPWRDGPAMTTRPDATPLPARAIYRRTTEPAPPARPLADAVLAEAIYLSVVVPAYNEQERIADSLYRIKEYLRAQPYRSEIIVVDDGSADLTTEVVKTIDIYGQEIHEQSPGELLENIKNVGKGFSIARGLLKARGTIVLFTDADLSTPIEELEKLLPHFDAGHALVIGSRKAADAVVEKKPLLRRIMSKTLHLLVQALTVPGIQDTQCGFKAYKRETAHRLAILQRIYGFAFDMEHLYIARRLGLSIKEVGVRWEHREGSKVHPIRDSYRMFRDMLKIRLYHRRLRPAKAS